LYIQPLTEQHLCTAITMIWHILWCFKWCKYIETCRSTFC